MKIICIGRNYADHAAEMKAELPKAPVFFMKPDTALLRESAFYLPSFTQDMHYECELVVKIDKMGKHIDPAYASNYYSKISLGIDFTARDLQSRCKEKGLPWEMAKAFDNSAVVSDRWLPVQEFPLAKAQFSFYQNDVLKQQASGSEMLFSIDQILGYVSQFITLKTGDLIFTGTPAGVGPIAIGDVLKGVLEGQEMFQITVK
jgi:2-keto-4-pentenoate hydratase/2-oxohepta-3-ene-1,7-dioic acid hydratase in catechol pathway